MLYNSTDNMALVELSTKQTSVILGTLGMVLSSCSSTPAVAPLSNITSGVVPCSIDVGTSSMFGMARTLNDTFQGSHTLVEDGTKATFRGTEADGSIQIVIGVWGGRQSQMTQILETYEPGCDVVAFGDEVLRNEVDDLRLDIAQVVSDKIDFDVAATERYPHLREMTIATAHQTNRDPATEKVVEPRRTQAIGQLKDGIKKAFRNVTIWKNSKQKDEDIHNPKAIYPFKGTVNVWDSSEIASLQNGNETPFESDGMHYKPWWLLQLDKVLETFHKSAFVQSTP